MWQYPQIQSPNAVATQQGLKSIHINIGVGVPKSTLSRTNGRIHGIPGTWIDCQLKIAHTVTTSGCAGRIGIKASGTPFAVYLAITNGHRYSNFFRLGVGVVQIQQFLI